MAQITCFLHPKLKTVIKTGLIVMSFCFLLLLLISISVTSLDDPVSKNLRALIERNINGYIKYLTNKAAKGSLTSFDKAVLHACALTGIIATRFIYPEGSIVIYHYIYADGADLALSPDYFKKSAYLKRNIKSLGKGEHGPIGLEQSEDMRLSLALNPYYLRITENVIRIYHPRIDFAPVGGQKCSTTVPLGKMELRVYDNLVSAMNPTPFYVYAEWEVD